MQIKDNGAWESGTDGVTNATSIAIRSLIFFHGYGDGDGGGILANGYIDLHISDSAFLWCAASVGGGAISTQNGVSLSMKRTKLAHNVGKAYGGAIFLQRKKHAILLE